MVLNLIYCILISFFLPTVGLCQAFDQLQKQSMSVKDLSKLKENKDQIRGLNKESGRLIIDLSKINFNKKNIEINKEQRIGPGSGGGGNSCAMMIKLNTEVLLSQLESFTLIKQSSINYDLLINKIITAKFIQGENLFLDQKKVEAINYPTENTIVIEQEFCNQMLNQSAKSLAILLHEYLGLALIDDTQFQLSSKYIMLFTDEEILRSHSEILLEQGSDIFQCAQINNNFDTSAIRLDLSTNRFLEEAGFRSVKNKQETKTMTMYVDKTDKVLEIGTRNKKMKFILDGKQHLIASNPEYANYYLKYRAGCINRQIVIVYEGCDNGQVQGEQTDQSGDRPLLERVQTYAEFITITTDYTGENLHMKIFTEIIESETNIKKTVKYAYILNAI